MYIFVSWIWTWVLVNVYFRVFIVIFVITMTAWFFLSPILRLNKADWIYLQSLPVWESVPYNTVLPHGLMNGFADWYMYVYMYVLERQHCCVTVWLYVFGDKWLGHNTLIFYLIVWLYVLDVNGFVMALLLFIHFYSSSSWKWHDLLMYSIYGIVKNDVSWENIHYILWYIKRNNCIVKNILIVWLLLLG